MIEEIKSKILNSYLLPQEEYLALAADHSDIRSAVFDICESVTGGREHLDVKQCLANIKAKLKDQNDE